MSRPRSFGWKRPAAYILIAVLSLLLVLLSFLYWASAPAHSLRGYSRIYSYGQAGSAFSDTLSVMTWNIGWLSGMSNNKAVERPCTLFENNLHSAIAVIRELYPDVILFQEMDFGSHRSCRMMQLDSLARACGYPYAAMAVNWDDRYVPFPYWPPKVHFGSVYSGLAVLSRYPILGNGRILHRATLPRPFYWKAFYLQRLFQKLEIQWGSDTFGLINVHLEAYDRNTREKQALELLDYVSSGSKQRPGLIAGDFNAFWNDSGTQTAEKTVKAFLESGYRTSCDEGDSSSASFTFSSEEPAFRIDYLLSDSARLRVIDCRVVPEMGTVSDHLPVMARFVIKRKWETTP